MVAEEIKDKVEVKIEAKAEEGGNPSDRSHPGGNERIHSFGQA